MLAFHQPTFEFRQIADATPALLWLSHPDGRRYFFNRRWLEFTGREMAEEQGEGWTAGVEPADVAACQKILASAVHAREPFECQYRLRNRDGDYCWILDRGAPRFAENGDFLGFTGCATEINGFQQPQPPSEPHSDPDRTYLMNTAHCLLWQATVYDTDASLLQWEMEFPPDEIAHRFLPLTLLPGQSYSHAFYRARLEEDRVRCDHEGTLAIREGRSFEQEFRTYAADGSLRWLHEFIRVEPVLHKRIWKVSGVCVDVTTRKEAEIALKRQTEQQALLLEISQLLLESAPGNPALTETFLTRVISYLDADTCCYYLLNAAGELRPTTTLDRSGEGSRFLSGQQAEPLLSRRVAETGAPLLVEPGEECAYIGYPLLASTGNLLGVLSVSRYRNQRFSSDDANFIKTMCHFLALALERAQTERALRESEQRFTSLATAAPGVLYSFRWQTDGSVSFPYSSPGIEKIYGLSPEALARDASPIEKVIPADDQERLARSLSESAASLTLWQDQWRVEAPGGSIIWLEGHSMPVREPDGSTIWYGVLMDITERKRSEQDLHHLMESARCLLWSAEVSRHDPSRSEPENLRWHYLHFDENAAQRFLPLPLRSNQTYAQASYANRHPSDRQRIDREAARYIQEGKDYSQEYRVRGLNRTWHWMREDIRVQQVGPWRWRIVSVVVDITEQKRAEEAIRRQREFLRSVIDSDPNYIFVKDAEGRFILANHALARAYGTTVENLEGKTDADFNLDSAAVAAYRRADQRTLALMQDTIIPEEYMPLPDGSRRWLQTTKRPIVSMDGKSYQVLGISSDITAHRQDREALRQSEERLQRAQSIARLGYIDYNPGNKQIYWSDETFLILGYRPQEFEPTAERFFSRLHPLEAKQVLEEIRASYREGRVARAEFRIFLPEGQVRWAYIQGEANYDAEGNVSRYVATVLDITFRKQAEAEIHELNATLEQRVAERTAQLEAANKELEAFAYSVSHDLRAPLRSIDGFSQALLEDYHSVLDATGREYLDHVRSASQRMADLIDDLLSLSRVTSSPMYRREVDLSEAARQIYQHLALTNPQRARQVEFLCPPGIWASCDERLLRIVLENLLANAWKYTSRHESARIEFGVTPTAEGQVYFVRDDGAGFDMTYADKLFGVFQRLHRSNEFDGTGIGLATVQRIIHRHGGRIWAEAAPEQGATFYFTVHPTLNPPPASRQDTHVLQ